MLWTGQYVICLSVLNILGQLQISEVMFWSLWYKPSVRWYHDKNNTQWFAQEPVLLLGIYTWILGINHMTASQYSALTNKDLDQYTACYWCSCSLGCIATMLLRNLWGAHLVPQKVVWVFLFPIRQLTLEEHIWIQRALLQLLPDHRRIRRLGHPPLNCNSFICEAITCHYRILQDILNTSWSCLQLQESQKYC